MDCLLYLSDLDTHQTLGNGLIWHGSRSVRARSAAQMHALPTGDTLLRQEGALSVSLLLLVWGLQAGRKKVRPEDQNWGTGLGDPLEAQPALGAEMLPLKMVCEVITHQGLLIHACGHVVIRNHLSSNVRTRRKSKY